MSPAAVTAVHRASTHRQNAPIISDEEKLEAPSTEQNHVQDSQFYQAAAYGHFMPAYAYQSQMAYSGYDRPMYSAYPYPHHPLYQQQSIASGTPYIPPSPHSSSPSSQSEANQAHGNEPGTNLPAGTAPGTIPVTMFPTMISYNGVIPLSLPGQEGYYEGHVNTWNGAVVMQPPMQHQHPMKVGHLNGRSITPNDFHLRNPYYVQSRVQVTGLHHNSRLQYGSNDRNRGRMGMSRGVSPTSSSGLLDPYDISNEQNRGPRTMRSKGQKTAPDTGLPKDIDISGINSPNFQTKYDRARFFVIKSYSEDDVHKSIKYQVWASTPIGNKRLEAAYLDSKKSLQSDGKPYPIFLLFSVNASGQFCGVAEMVGPVDHSMSVEYWQQDKWSGLFKVKWHMSKDVPNSHFRHIILANNENKPITNSRDTQEVIQHQGEEFLEIFKKFNARTSILDDFGFYDERQKAMQEKRNKLKPKPEENLHLSEGSSYSSSVQSEGIVSRGNSSIDSLDNKLHRLSVAE